MAYSFDTYSLDASGNVTGENTPGTGTTLTLTNAHADIIGQFTANRAACAGRAGARACCHGGRKTHLRRVSPVKDGKSFDGFQRRAAESRPSKARSKALSAAFQRMAQRLRPVPVGSRLMTAK